MLRRSSSRMFQMLNVSVDGNISSGKSTLVQRLVESFPRFDINGYKSSVQVFPEPLEKWCDLKGHNLLGMFYEDPTRNNFIFQHYVQLTRLMDTVKQLNLKDDSCEESAKSPFIRLMERSLQNNRYCFIEMARKQGNLQDPEFAVLVEWYNWLEQNLDLQLDIIIYLRTNPDVVYSRMKSRGRTEESTVPLDYLTELHNTYEDWLVHKKQDQLDNVKQQFGNNGKRMQEVIVVNGNQGKKEVFDEVSLKLTEHLSKFMSNILTSSNNPTVATPTTPNKNDIVNGIH